MINSNRFIVSKSLLWMSQLVLQITTYNKMERKKTPACELQRVYSFGTKNK